MSLSFATMSAPLSMAMGPFHRTMPVMSAAETFKYPLPMVIGHRGAKQIAPENTIASMRAAKAVGATCVEVDVMLTKDGVPVIHHDNSVDRCTNGKGHVSEQTWQEIQLLDAGSYFCPDFEGERIPTLTELVEECTSLGLGLNIEIKHSNDDATVPASAEELQRERDLAKVTCQTLLALDANPERVFLSSFSIAALEVAQQMLPHFKRSYLVEDIPAGWEETVRRLGCVSFNFNWKKASREQVEACARTGVPLYAYTVNDPEVAEQLISWGLSGVFSDCPHEVRRHLWRLQRGNGPESSPLTSRSSRNLQRAVPSAASRIQFPINMECTSSMEESICMPSGTSGIVLPLVPVLPLVH
jgi:glycerophosphoryl diester phosphodiesterase